MGFPIGLVLSGIGSGRVIYGRESRRHRAYPGRDSCGTDPASTEGQLQPGHSGQNALHTLVDLDKVVYIRAAQFDSLLNLLVLSLQNAGQSLLLLGNGFD